MTKRKTIIITGASRGLGEAIAKRCLRTKENLILLSRNEPGIHLSMNSDWYSCDLREESEVYSVVLKILKEYDTIDAIINNAGMQGDIESLSEISSWKTWKDVINTNLLSPILLIKMLLQRMPDGGKIINISGGGATSPREGLSAYATSKTGLVRFSETLACELSRRKIDVNCISPGAMYSAMTDEAISLGENSHYEKEYLSAITTKKTGGFQKDKVTELIMFLLSEHSNGITGKLISAQWDNWKKFPMNPNIKDSDVYTLRRIVAKDRKDIWDGLDK